MRLVSITRLCLAGLLCALLAAASGAGAAEGPQVWRGNFAIGRQGAVFSPCLSGLRLEVADATANGALSAAYREFAPQPGKPIFVEFTGVRAGDRVRADRLHRASRDGPGCREALAQLRVAALGSDPVWSFELRAEGARLQRQREFAPREFPPGALTSGRSGEMSYEGASATSVLRLTVRPGECRDALSGALFDHSAELRIDGVLLKGCAYRGDLERPLP